jgi:NADH-quinone oxidoreductase subunit E
MASFRIAPDTSEVDVATIDGIVERYRDRPGAILGVLEETQKAATHAYLSQGALAYVAHKTGVPQSTIYGIVTFYAFFNLRPQGDHTITVCRGTACHTRGSKALLDDCLIRMGGAAARDGRDGAFTTPDAKFTIRTVACFGQCALAPVAMIDETIHSSVTVSRLQKLIEAVGGERGEQGGASR